MYFIFLHVLLTLNKQTNEKAKNKKQKIKIWSFKQKNQYYNIIILHTYFRLDIFKTYSTHIQNILRYYHVT